MTKLFYSNQFYWTTKGLHSHLGTHMKYMFKVLNYPLQSNSTIVMKTTSSLVAKKPPSTSMKRVLSTNGSNIPFLVLNLIKTSTRSKQETGPFQSLLHEGQWTQPPRSFCPYLSCWSGPELLLWPLSHSRAGRKRSSGLMGHLTRQSCLWLCLIPLGKGVSRLGLWFLWFGLVKNWRSRAPAETHLELVGSGQMEGRYPSKVEEKNQCHHMSSLDKLWQIFLCSCKTLYIKPSLPVQQLKQNNKSTCQFSNLFVKNEHMQCKYATLFSYFCPCIYNNTVTCFDLLTSTYQ